MFVTARRVTGKIRIFGKNCHPCVISKQYVTIFIENTCTIRDHHQHQRRITELNNHRLSAVYRPVSTSSSRAAAISQISSSSTRHHNNKTWSLKHYCFFIVQVFRTKVTNVVNSVFLLVTVDRVICDYLDKPLSCWHPQPGYVTRPRSFLQGEGQHSLVQKWSQTPRQWGPGQGNRGHFV